jgi:hypothetical protein
MHVYIVKHEVSAAIEHYSYSYAKQIAVWIYNAQVYKQNAGYGKNNGKNIVPFNFTSIADVVVAVKKPHKAVHNVLVGKPCHKFHKKEGRNYQ